MTGPLVFYSIAMVQSHNFIILQKYSVTIGRFLINDNSNTNRDNQSFSLVFGMFIGLTYVF